MSKIEKTQQNSRYRLCGDRDKTMNHMISEWSKLTQESIQLDTTRWANVIHWESRKKFKFDHASK